MVLVLLFGPGRCGERTPPRPFNKKWKAKMFGSSSPNLCQQLLLAPNYMQCDGEIHHQNHFSGSFGLGNTCHLVKPDPYLNPPNLALVLRTSCETAGAQDQVLWPHDHTPPKHIVAKCAPLVENALCHLPTSRRSLVS